MYYGTLVLDAQIASALRLLLKETHGCDVRVSLVFLLLSISALSAVLRIILIFLFLLECSCGLLPTRPRRGMLTVCV